VGHIVHARSFHLKPMRVIRTRRGAIFRLMSHFRHRPSYLTTNLHTGTFLKSFPDQLHGA
jgi:hypothetical protein